MKHLLMLAFLTAVLVGFSGTTFAQDFIGSDQCMTCHNSVNPNLGYNIWEEYNKTGHPYKLNEVAGAPPVYPANTSPGVPNPPANQNWSDFSHVIGGYGWKARFISASDGFVFVGTEVQYNLFATVRGTPEWVDYHVGQPTPYNYNCFTCHTTGGDPTGSWHPTTPDLGTFTEPGIRCEGCHGPGSDHQLDPSNVSLPITGMDLQINRCGDCHQRGGTTNAIPSSGGFIRHHEQLNEMRASQHGNQDGVDLTCASCHDTHIAVHFPEAAGEGLTGIVAECESCHSDREIQFDPAGPVHSAECVDCHMPHASKSAIGTAEGNGWKGDVATHIMGINTDAVTRDAMFTPDNLVALDGEGIARVTLDFVCLPCHQTQDVAWASGFAQDIHTRFPVGIGDHTNVALTFQLEQNYPNPFNPTTTIGYSLSERAEIRLVVYNLLGQEVAVLADGVKTAGSHTATFAAQDLTSGVYVYRLEADGTTLSKKMVLMR